MPGRQKNLIRDEGARGSNPLTPTNKINQLRQQINQQHPLKIALANRLANNLQGYTRPRCPSPANRARRSMTTKLPSSQAVTVSPLSAGIPHVPAPAALGAKIAKSAIAVDHSDDIPHRAAHHVR